MMTITHRSLFAQRSINAAIPEEEFLSVLKSWSNRLDTTSRYQKFAESWRVPYVDNFSGEIRQNVSDYGWSVLVDELLALETTLTESAVQQIDKDIYFLQNGRIISTVRSEPGIPSDCSRCDKRDRNLIF